MALTLIARRKVRPRPPRHTAKNQHSNGLNGRSACGVLPKHAVASPYGLGRPAFFRAPASRATNRAATVVYPLPEGKPDHGCVAPPIGPNSERMCADTIEAKSVGVGSGETLESR